MPTHTYTKSSEFLDTMSLFLNYKLWLGSLVITPFFDIFILANPKQYLQVLVFLIFFEGFTLIQKFKALGLVRVGEKLRRCFGKIFQYYFVLIVSKVLGDYMVIFMILVESRSILDNLALINAGENKTILTGFSRIINIVSKKVNLLFNIDLQESHDVAWKKEKEALQRKDKVDAHR